MNKRIKYVLIILAVLVIGAAALYLFGGAIWKPMTNKLIDGRTTAQAIDEIRPEHEQAIQLYCTNAGVEKLPDNLTLVALKEEQKLEVWTQVDGVYKHLHTYDILARSGEAGPKRKEGDRQIPEGIYHIVGFNPNSAYTLSMKLDYPNEFDKEKAALEQRANLGGDIFIHGKAVSIGCIAIGDDAISELFLLVYDVGRQNVTVIISPNDLRTKPRPEVDIEWADELYDNISNALRVLMQINGE